MKLNFPSLQALLAIADKLPLRQETNAQTAALQQLEKVALSRLPEGLIQISPQNRPVAGQAWFAQIPAGIELPASGTHYFASVEEGNRLLLLSSESRNLSVVVNQQQLTSLLQLLSLYRTADPLAPPLREAASVVSVDGQVVTLKLASLPKSPVTLTLPPGQPRPTGGDKIALEFEARSSQQWALKIQQSTSLDAPADKSAAMGVSPRHPLVQRALQAVLKQGVSLDNRHSVDPRPTLQQLTGDLGLARGEHQTNWQVKLNANRLVIRQTTLAVSAQITLPAQDKAAFTPLPVPLRNDKIFAQPALRNAPLLALSTEQPVTQAPKVPETTSTAEFARQSQPPSNTEGPSKAELQSQIRQLSRILLAETGSTQLALSQLLRGLSQPEMLPHPASRALASQIVSQLKGETAHLTATTEAELPAGNETTTVPKRNDSTHSQGSQFIQALLASPALPLTSAALTAPSSPSAFINGLVTLLQLTLAGKAVKNNSALLRQADELLSGLTSGLSSSATTTAPSAARVLQDFTQLDTKFQMLKQIKTLLANHQQQKLGQAENRLQNLDSFYYVLPVVSDNQAPPEILIRRENNHDQKNTDSNTDKKYWNLTMKLDVGELGQLLAKAKITGDTLNLDLYTSSDPLLSKVADTLPWLTRRLTALGLEIEHTSFQRGRIPPSLQEKPYQLFEARV